VRSCGVALALAFGTAFAQSYPVKPVRLIAASSPGSAVDIVARSIAQKLAENLGQQIVIDNRAGAGGNIGAEIAAHAPADGYTLFIGTPAHAIAPSLYRKPGYDLARDFTPVSQLITGQYCVVVPPSMPAKTVKELIALARRRPGELNFASAGVGNATHLAGELFKSMAAIDIVHVAYKGSGPALTDLLGGQVQLMFPNLVAALPFVPNGRLRMLAVTGSTRSAALPAYPTVAEAGVPGYEVTSWFGLFAPAGTPAAITGRLNDAVRATMRAPELRDRLAAEGAEPHASAADELARLVRTEVAKWAKVIKVAGIKPEG